MMPQTSVEQPVTPAPSSGTRTPFGFELAQDAPVETHDQMVARRTASQQVGRERAAQGEPSMSPSTQRFVANVLSGHPITELEANDPERFFNSKDPNIAIMTERPEHLAVAVLKSQAMSNNDIAVKTGYSVPWVSQVTRQPWFKLRVARLMTEAGLDVVTETLRATTLDSVYTLIDMRDKDTNPASVRVKAAETLLDRVLGKAVQRVETTVERIPNSEEISALDQQIAESTKRLATLSNETTQ